MSSQHPGRIRNPETGKIDFLEVWYKVRAALAVLLSLAILGGGGWFVYNQASKIWSSMQVVEDYTGEGGDPVEVIIPKGATLAEIAGILVESNVVKTERAFNREVAANEDSKKIQAGKYQMKTQIPAKLALAMLLDPANLIRSQFTIPEGRWLAQQWPTLAKSTGVAKDDFKAAAKDWKKLGLPKWAQNGLEGFLYPETYEIPENPTAVSVIKMATRQFGLVSKELKLEAGAAKLKMDPYEVLVAASIIEREAGRDEDRAKVARVILNRLKIGMKLQMDSTVAYANKVTGRVFTTAQERALASPYNTYYTKGLPKGPITSPTRKSIEAALNPAKGDWLYFVAVNLDTGESKFSKTAAEHAKAQAELQKWCKASQANRDKCNGKK